MAEPENQNSSAYTPNFIFYRRYYDYEGPSQRVMFLVKEFYFDHCRIIYILTPQAFVNLG